ncbi:hypothetical protein [Pseudodonghicola flavimaris]|uniref:Uncharacterized protein n=1 Tax=Pseudodonghicola flavimaris TaxID=3050036 RepID=A0ABT7EVY6_9RHOB|nr:hypothetical protein [Pseudodonghicola flavimaris]MDK3016510.1 hypothetical protein [Pseudodonghicola flavimaris]
MNVRSRIKHMSAPVFVRMINLATGVQESEEVMDHDNHRHRATLEGRMHWALRNGRTVTVGPMEVPECPAPFAY